jgi:hypothetical protein
MAYVRKTRFCRLGKGNISDAMESAIPCLHAIQKWFQNFCGWYPQLHKYVDPMKKKTLENEEIPF